MPVVFLEEQGGSVRVRAVLSISGELGAGPEHTKNVRSFASQACNDV
jgi:hypothetical protein